MRDDQFRRLLYLLFIGLGGIIAIMLGYGWWFFGAVAAFEVYCALVVWIRWHAY